MKAFEEHNTYKVQNNKYDLNKVYCIRLFNNNNNKFATFKSCDSNDEFTMMILNNENGEYCNDLGVCVRSF